MGYSENTVVLLYLTKRTQDKKNSLFTFLKGCQIKLVKCNVNVQEYVIVSCEYINEGTQLVI